MEGGGEGGELRRGCAPLLLGQGGRGGVGRRLVVAASMLTIVALKEKGGGGSGEGRRFGWGSRLVDAPAMEEEGGQRGGQDGSVRRRPTEVEAQSCLTGGRRRPAGPSGLKGFLGRTVLLGQTDWVGQNQIKSFSNFYLNSGI
jgi:hypothetical protein